MELTIHRNKILLRQDNNGWHWRLAGKVNRAKYRGPYHSLDAAIRSATQELNPFLRRIY